MAAERTPTTSAWSWRAMGSDAEVLVVGDDPALAETARDRVDQLERRWSRFLPTSEVSELTRRSGEAVEVSHDTAVLVERAVQAWRLTGAAVDPTVLGAVLRAGYDRSIETMADRARAPWSALALAGCTDIEVGRRADGTWTVRLPEGTGFDPGGLGKGLAADLVVGELLAAGAAGACVNLGGDLRVAGQPPSGAGWTVQLDAPAGDRPLARLGLAGGAVATSSTLRRTWRVGGRRYHHLIDPRTGEPSTTDLVQASVVAAEAWVAEALAKAVLLRGAAGAFDLLPPGVEAAAVHRDGSVLATPGLEVFLGGAVLPRRVVLWEVAS